MRFSFPIHWSKNFASYFLVQATLEFLCATYCILLQFGKCIFSRTKFLDTLPCILKEDRQIPAPEGQNKDSELVV
jgi:hypothetical protein